jgi:hypothetical protein
MHAEAFIISFHIITAAHPEEVDAVGVELVPALKLFIIFNIVNFFLTFYNPAPH